MESAIGYLSPDERLEFVEKQGGIVQGRFRINDAQRLFAVKLYGVFQESESNTYSLDVYEGDLRDEDFPVKLKARILHQKKEICEIMARLHDEQVRARDACLDVYDRFLNEVHTAQIVYEKQQLLAGRFGASAIRRLMDRGDVELSKEKQDRLDAFLLGEEHLKRRAAYEEARAELKVDMGHILDEYSRINDEVFECVLNGEPMDRAAIEYGITRIQTDALRELTEAIEVLRKKLDLPTVPDSSGRKSPYR